MLSRSVISNLRPMLASTAPLVDVLADLTIGFSDIARGVTVELIAETEGARSYGEAIDLSVYRFVQESVLNAIKHGRATYVSVKLEPRHDTEELVARVRDNGCGPKMPDAPPGYGQLGITDRIQAMGGTYRRPVVESGETVTEIVLPLHES